MARKVKTKEFDPNYNHREPAVLYRFEQELVKIGQSTPLGPRLRRVWGCTEKWFRLGKKRLKYLTGYALSRESKADLVTGLPYVEDYVEELGLARHIIEVWLPPAYFGSGVMDTTLDITMGEGSDIVDKWRASWEEHRFEFIQAESVTPETVARMNLGIQDKDALASVGSLLIDNLGEFPINGDYRFFYTIQHEDGEYKDPDMDDIDFLKRSYAAGYEMPQKKIKDTRAEKEQEYVQQLFNPDDLHKEAEKALSRMNRIFHDLSIKKPAVKTSSPMLDYAIDMATRRL